MDTYKLRIDSESPLLMHADDLDHADAIEAWLEEPGNAKRSKPGDDRTPAWRWMGCLYHDGEHVAMPQENLRKMLTQAAAQVPLKGKLTFKSRMASGILFTSPCAKFFCRGKPIRWDAVEAIANQGEYRDHAKAVQKLGFSLMAKRATIGAAKHVRVRPMFNDWAIEAEVVVIDPAITESKLLQIAQIGVSFIGLCDWRPGAPKSPGPYGRGKVSITKIA